MVYAIDLKSIFLSNVSCICARGAVVAHLTFNQVAEGSNPSGHTANWSDKRLARLLNNIIEWSFVKDFIKDYSSSGLMAELVYAVVSKATDLVI